MNAMLEEAKQLLLAAERDRTSFWLLMDSGRAPHETMGFLAQQACEKSIKAVMVAASIRVERTHDVEFLAQLAHQGGVNLPVSVEQLRLLNPYAVALRYEGLEVEWISMAEAGHLVEVLHQWAVSFINSKDITN
jgi:HEPN domain-containing protein